MARKDIGVGIIGTGMGANMLFLNRDPNSRFEVRAACSPTEAKVRKLAEEWSLPFWTTDYRALVQRDDIQVVGVYSPDHLHAEHALAALNAGKHVVCTKPMCTNDADAAALIEAVERTGLKFLVGQTMRFDPEFANAHRMLDGGDLGEVIFAEAHYVHDIRPVWSLTPWRLQVPQDFMYGGACHPVDLLRWFLGDVEEVHAYGRKGNLTPEYAYHDNYLLNLKFKSGAIARVLAAYGLVEPPMPMMGLSLFCTRGSLVADFTDRQAGHLRFVLDKLEGHQPASITYPPELEGAFGHGAGVARYMAHFEECLRDDKTPVPDVHEGAKSIAVCSAAWRSIREGGVQRPRV